MAGKAEYKNQWQKENCDRVNLTLPKGRKAELQAYAAAAGESLNGFINRSITCMINKEVFDLNAEQFYIDNIEEKTKHLQDIHFDVLRAFLDAGISQVAITKDFALSQTYGQMLFQSEIFPILEKRISGFSSDIGFICVRDLISVGFLFVVRDTPDKEIALAITNLGIKCLLHCGKAG